MAYEIVSKKRNGNLSHGQKIAFCCICNKRQIDTSACSAARNRFRHLLSSDCRTNWRLLHFWFFDSTISTHTYEIRVSITYIKNSFSFIHLCHTHTTHGTPKLTSYFPIFFFSFSFRLASSEFYIFKWSFFFFTFYTSTSFSFL